MIKAFVSSDVILDFLAHRVPHFHFAALLFTFADMQKIELYTSPAALMQVGAILKKQHGNEEAKKILRKLRLIIHVADSDERALDRALNADSADFPLALEWYTAEAHDLPVVITRDGLYNKATGVQMQSPEMFLKQNGFLE